MSRHQYCTFHLDNLLLGIAVHQVQEVIRSYQLTRVPLAPPGVEGLINLRGQIVTALDLRQRFELPPRAADAPRPTSLVVRTPDGPVSLLVDRIGDVLEVTDDDFERPPETLTGAARAFIKGAYKLPNRRLLLSLETEKAFILRAA